MVQLFIGMDFFFFSPLQLIFISKIYTLKGILFQYLKLLQLQYFLVLKVKVCQNLGHSICFVNTLDICYYIMSRKGYWSQKISLRYILILFLQLVSKTVHTSGVWLYSSVMLSLSLLYANLEKLLLWYKEHRTQLPGFNKRKKILAHKPDASTLVTNVCSFVFLLWHPECWNIFLLFYYM